MIALIVYTFIFGYHNILYDYFGYKNITQSGLFFASKNVTQSVWLFEYKKLKESAFFLNIKI